MEKSLSTKAGIAESWSRRKHVKIPFGTAARSSPTQQAIKPCGYAFVALLLYAKSFLFRAM
jgi:hypothetical protein